VPHRKGGPARGPGHIWHVRQAPEMAERYAAKFGQTPAKAAPDLFTFVPYRMEPASNRSERAMRFVVGRRSVRMQVCGMRRRNALWTRIRTWRLRGAPTCRELRGRVAEGTLANSCRA